MVGNAEDDRSVSKPRWFRWARQRLDGASLQWIAEHADASDQEVADAWDYCRELLSAEFSDSKGPLISDQTIFERREKCLRLLLSWEQSTELASRVRSIGERGTGDS